MLQLFCQHYREQTKCFDKTMFLNSKQVRHHNNYRKTSNISRTLESNKIVDNSDVVGASPVGAAPTTSSLLA